MGRALSRHAWRTSPPRILLAEDDSELRRLIGTLLRKDGYLVIEVSDGSQMLDFLGSQRLANRDSLVDLVISDVRMPKRTGLDVISGLREHGRDTPVVFISAFADEDLRHSVDALGRAALLSKPFDTDVLRDVVDYLFRNAA
jgi:CheY-like chemotaxis protein